MFTPYNLYPGWQRAVGSVGDDTLYRARPSCYSGDFMDLIGSNSFTIEEKDDNIRLNVFSYCHLIRRQNKTENINSRCSCVFQEKFNNQQLTAQIFGRIYARTQIDRLSQLKNHTANL